MLRFEIIIFIIIFQEEYVSRLKVYSWKNILNNLLTN